MDSYLSQLKIQSSPGPSLFLKWQLDAIWIPRCSWGRHSFKSSVHAFRERWQWRHSGKMSAHAPETWDSSVNRLRMPHFNRQIHTCYHKYFFCWIRYVTEEVRRNLSWKRQPYLFWFGLVHAKWEQATGILQMPPFCRVRLLTRDEHAQSFCRCVESDQRLINFHVQKFDTPMTRIKVFPKLKLWSNGPEQWTSQEGLNAIVKYNSQKYLKKLLNAEVHTTQELNLLVILPDLSCERPRVRRHLNVKIQNWMQGWHYGKGQIY